MPVHISLKDKIKDGVLDVLGFNPGKNITDNIHPEVVRSQELLEHYQGQASAWQTKFQEAEQFRNGVQWDEDEETELTRRGQAPLVINRIHPLIETAKAMLTANKPRFSATAREDSDRATAKLFSDLFAWVWEQSQGNMELKRAIDDYYVGGMGCILVYQDPNADNGKGEVKLKSIYPLDVYIDPNSRDPFCRDATNILIAQRLTDEQGFSQYPQYRSIIKSANESYGDRYPGTNLANTEEQQFVGDHDDSYHTKREYISRFTRIRVPFYHIYEPGTGYEGMFNAKQYEEYRKQPAGIVEKTGESKDFAMSEEAVAKVSDMIRQTGGVFHLEPVPAFTDPSTGQAVQQPPRIVPGEENEESIPGSTVYMSITTKGKLIDKGLEDAVMMNVLRQYRWKEITSVGNKLMYTRILPLDIPPVITMMNIHNRNPYPESDVRLYKPIQHYINKIESLKVAHASNSTNVKVFLPRGAMNKAVLEDEFGRTGTAVLEYNPEFGAAPIIAAPVPLPTELYKNQQDAKYDLEYGFGIHDIMMGATKNAPSTFRGTVAIDEYGQRRSKSKRDDVEECINQIARVAVPLMQQLYTEEKVIRLLNPDNTERSARLNMPVYDEYTKEEIGKIHDITAGRYDIIVVSGSTLPSNRWAQFEYYKELADGNYIDQIELLKKTEVVDTEGVLERMGYIRQLEMALEQAKGEIKKLSGDLQTAEREEVHAKKRLEVEKFKSDLSAASNKAGMASSLYQSRLDDELAKVRQMVKPGGEAGRS